MTHHKFALVSAALGLFVGGGGARAASYTITNVGAALGAASVNPSTATAVNAAGQVTGFYTVGTGYGQSLTGFVYSGGAVTSFDAGTYAQPTSVNAAGVVTLAGGGLYRPGLGVTAIPAAPGATRVTSAGQVNAAGLVVGTEYVPGPSGYDVSHPYVYNSVTGVTTDLPTTAFGNTAASFDNGTGINTAGHIVGSIGYVAPGTTYPTASAFLATPNAGGGYAFTNVGAAVTAAIGGYRTTATAVSENDIVVGVDSTDAGDQPYVYRSGVVAAVGILDSSIPYQIGTAEDVNSSGVVVGQATFSRDPNTFNRVYHAYAYLNGATVDLNSLIDASSGWVLTNATGINDAGQIVGVGTFNGQSTAFLLNPTLVPEPAGLGLLAAGGVLVLRRRRA